MTVTSALSDDNSQLTIAIEGRFDFSSQLAFRAAYEPLRVKPQTVVVNMAGTNHLDSSALGMLLLLREHVGGEKACVTIVNCSPDIKKTFSAANFDQLFAIS